MSASDARSGGAAPRFEAWDEAGSWLDNLARPELGPVSWLAELAPSGRLMCELEGLPSDVVEDDYDAIEVVAHWNRLEAYCAARKRLAAASLARRHSMAAGLAALQEIRDMGGGGVVVDTSVAADELGVRLGIARRTAQRLITSGKTFSGAGLLTAEALVTGQIDAVKADLILDAVADLPADAALDVQQQVLDRAAHLPLPALRRETNAACAGVDVAEFEQRCRAERAKRRVCRPRALPHGMAGLYAVLPAVEATQLYRAVDAAARSAKSVGDARTMDQLRADALALMGEAAIQSGWIGGPPPRPDGAPPEPDGTPPGADGTSPERGRTSPEPGRTTGRRATSDTPASAGVRPAPRGAPDVADQAGRAHRPGRSAPPPGTTGGACPETGARTGVSPPDGGMRLGVLGGRSAHVRVVVPLNVLMGQAGAEAHLDSGAGRGERGAGQPAAGVDAPAHLDGYGPIPAAVARALAAGSTWARLVTDPVDGSVRELSAPTYRPPAALADLVRAERPMCIVPGCSVEADSCDLDHSPPWPIGATEFDRLAPLCRHHHELVTHAGWRYHDVSEHELNREPRLSDQELGDGREPPGSDRADPVARRWTTGSGHAYTESAAGAMTMTGPRALAPRITGSIRPSTADTWGSPPF